jgi:hypothetical protein
MLLTDSPMGLLDDTIAPRQPGLAERLLSSLFAPGARDPGMAKTAVRHAGLAALGAAGQGASGLQAFGAAVGGGEDAVRSLGVEADKNRMQQELAALAQSGQLTPEVLKKVFQHAVATGNTNLANAVVGMMGNMEPEGISTLLAGEGNRYLIRRDNGEVLKDFGAPAVKPGTVHDGINPETGKAEQYVFDAQGAIKWLGIAPVQRSTGTTVSLVENQRKFTREQTLVNEYQEAVKPYKETFHKINGTLAAVPLAKTGDGAAQNELVVTFVVALDPTSVAREGEVDLARKAIKRRAKRWDIDEEAFDPPPARSSGAGAKKNMFSDLVPVK